MSNLAITPSIFGTGVAYPTALDSTGTRFASSSEKTLVQNSILAILQTDVSERPFLVRNGVPYGTRIRRALFEPLDIAFDIVVYECQRALTTWEPRIIVKSVSAAVNPAFNTGREIDATVFFVYRATNRPDNAVVPFFSAPTGAVQ